MGQITSLRHTFGTQKVLGNAFFSGAPRHPEFQGVGAYFAPFNNETEALRSWLYDNAGINLMVLSYSPSAKRWIDRHSNLLDFLMVDMDVFDDTGDGIDFALNLRVADPTLPVILTSSTTSEDDFGPERFPICDATLCKPLSFARTLDAIKMAVLAP